jgi:rod shape-determining protein MreD
MAFLLSFPVLTVLLVLQTAVISRIALLHGTADLLLVAVLAWALQKRVQTAWHWSLIAGLLVTLVSGLPVGVALVTYPLLVGLALLLKKRVWQMPILAMFIATFFGTLLVHVIDLAALRFVGHPLPVLESFNLITLPSAVLNLLFAVPIYVLLTDLANWLYPEQLEV